MKYLVALILITQMSYFNFAQAANSALQGTWHATFKCPKGADQDCKTEFFSIRLFIRDGKICGTHSSVVKGGNKVDAMLGSEPTLVGKLEGNNAKVSFVSSFGGSGQVLITLKGQKLQWRIVEDVDMHWLPSKAMMQRERNTKWGAQLHCGK